MMHLFPRQFGLHNVFTNEVDSKETVQRFKDYTLREDEIHGKFTSGPSIKIPKRLRGQASELVQKLQIQHSRCPYKTLLDHYCPVRSTYSILKAYLTNNILDSSSELRENLNRSPAQTVERQYIHRFRNTSFYV